MKLPEALLRLTCRMGWVQSGCATPPKLITITPFQNRATFCMCPPTASANCASPRGIFVSHPTRRMATHDDCGKVTDEVHIDNPADIVAPELQPCGTCASVWLFAVGPIPR